MAVDVSVSVTGDAAAAAAEFAMGFVDFFGGLLHALAESSRVAT